MRTRNYAAVAAMAATAVAAAAGTANAAPAPATDPGQNIVSNATDFFSAAAHQVLAPTAAQGQPVSLAIPTGTITVGGGEISMTGPSGTLTVGAPLAPVSAALAPVAPALLSTVDSALPAPAAVAPAAVATTPAAASVPGLKQVADPRFKTWQEREQWEFNRFKDGVSVTGTIAAATGAVVGGVVGCALGASLGTVATGPLAPLGAPALCAAGAAALSTVGAAGVGLLITLPVAAGLGINYLVQSQQPFVAPPAPAK